MGYGIWDMVKGEREAGSSDWYSKKNLFYFLIAFMIYKRQEKVTCRREYQNANER